MSFRLVSKPRVLIDSGSIPRPLRSYLQCPTPFETDEHVAVLVSSRDEQNRSHITRYLFDRDFKMVEAPRKPLLDLGEDGAFDSSGTMPGSVVRVDDEIWLYYIGWNVRKDVPFHNSIGLAISRDGGNSFEKGFRGPVLDRNINDPFFTSTPFVFNRDGEFEMYYLSGMPWYREGGALRSRYGIKHASSPNGVQFKTEESFVLEPTETEDALARPWITWTSSGDPLMFLCGRKDSYSIFSARQRSDNSWIRDPNPLISPATEGPFGNNVSYPAVWKRGDRTWFLFNGNDFGRDSVLLAEISIE